jgi:cytidylate kinase
MQIICVSMGTYGGAKELAQNLSEKMGYPCLCREDLIEAAIQEGIQVGKLEMAMVKPRGFTERLARERDHYLSFSRAFLCEQALKGNVIYYGRTGHLLLPGISHVLRVRVVWDMEHRIQAIMQKMGLEREKALRYVQEVDEDRARWVRAMYGIAVEEAINYDVTVNLQQLTVTNASSALVSVAQLPDFQMTPASEKALRDLHLGATARLALARDRRTHSAALKVRADAGVVTVSYRPQDNAVAKFIPPVLEPLEGVKDLRITMATANLLWIQEEFQPESELFGKVVEIATKWNAAVELLRLAPEGETPTESDESTAQAGFPADTISETGPRAVPDTGAPVDVSPPEYDGGIETDEEEEALQDGGLQTTLDKLAEVGRSGGGRSVFGNRQRLVDSLDRTFPYTLVVVGDLFLSKGHAARQRAIRDLRGFLEDRIRAPIVTADEIGSQYLFGKRDVLRAGFFLLVTIAVFVLVLTNQDLVLAFLANTGWYAEAAGRSALGRFEWLPKLVVSAALFLFIPVVAYSYGRVASTFLKLIKME